MVLDLSNQLSIQGNIKQFHQNNNTAAMNLDISDSTKCTYVLSSVLIGWTKKLEF